MVRPSLSLIIPTLHGPDGELLLQSPQYPSSVPTASLETAASTQDQRRSRARVRYADRDEVSDQLSPFPALPEFSPNYFPDLDSGQSATWHANDYYRWHEQLRIDSDVAHRREQRVVSHRRRPRRTPCDMFIEGLSLVLMALIVVTVVLWLAVWAWGFPR